MSSRTRRLAAAAAATAGLPLLAACATGFQAPTRHAIANMQAASAAVSSAVSLTDVQVFLPDGTASAGGVAYLELVVVNHGTADDTLQVANTTVTTTAGGGPSASPTPVAATITAVGQPTAPHGTQAAPGVARLTLALQALQVPLSAGDTVQVSLDFARAGTVARLLVPVLAGTDAGTFLPSAPPSAPSPSASASSNPPSPSSSASSNPPSPSSAAAS